FYVVVIEDGRAWLYSREEWLQLLEQPVVEYTGVRGRFVHVVFENVPTCEDKIVESGKRDKLLYLRRSSVGALAQPDRAHLGERPNRLRKPLANRFDAGYERGSHCAHAGDHHAQLPLGGIDGTRGFFFL